VAGGAQLPLGPLQGAEAVQGAGAGLGVGLDAVVGEHEFALGLVVVVQDADAQGHEAFLGDGHGMSVPFYRGAAPSFHSGRGAEHATGQAAVACWRGRMSR
jgi:hypothetical protein